MDCDQRQGRLFFAALKAAPSSTFHILEQAAHPFILGMFVQEWLDQKVGPGVTARRFRCQLLGPGRFVGDLGVYGSAGT